MTQTSNPRAPSARRRPREQTRRDLLDSARRVLARHGFHRTKVADIARDAHVAVGTFYLYYPTKEALFLELVEDTVRKLRGEIDRAHAAAADPRARARAGCETFLRFAEENRELFRIVFGHGATFHNVVAQAQRLFAADAAANIAAGMQAGIFRPSRPDIVAHALIGMLLQVVSWWIEQEEVSLSEVTEGLTDVLFHGLDTNQGSLVSESAAASAPE